MKKQTMIIGAIVFLFLLVIFSYANGGFSSSHISPIEKDNVNSIQGVKLVTGECSTCEIEDDEYAYPIMRPDYETRSKWIRLYNNAPRIGIEKGIGKNFKGSLGGTNFSLLSHLDYIPDERDQGICGNCWAWAGTGVLGIALDVQERTKDRLSVQYINSCGSSVINKTCCDGGWLNDLADFYENTSKAIPWSNTNAYWQDGDASCNTGCGTISANPRYPITSINEETIITHDVTNATAIANIKSVLNQNKAVWFGFYLPTDSDWDIFSDFWGNYNETDIWNPDYSCGHTWVNGDGGGHAVICIGYNDEDPDNKYWTMLNSWGTGPTNNRPNGLFRMDMNMSYDCYFLDPDPYQSFYWQTLNVTFDLHCVDDDADPSWYDANHVKTIQEGIDNASDGDIIFVFNGLYNENVVVNKSLTIQSENGSVNCIIQAANSNDHVLNVTVDYVNINGFTVKGATESNKAGIYLSEVEHCSVSGNTVSNNCYGIYLEDSNNNTLVNNAASNNYSGIYLQSSSGNTLTNNTANSNTQYGIYLQSSSGNLIYNNCFYNTNNVNDTGNNTWNTTKKLGTNIVGGSYTGGNFWNDYNGEDTNGNGLGNTSLPYNASRSIINGGDYHPLVPNSTVYNVNKGTWHSVIQGAVDNASTGNTLIAFNGTYHENILICKSITLQARYSAIIDGMNGTGISIEANNTAIQDMNVTNCSKGIYIYSTSFTVQNITLYGNTIYNNIGYGIECRNVSNSTIDSNCIYQNSNHGLHLNASTNNTIQNNNLSDNMVGMSLTKTSNNNVIKNNVIYSNEYNGFIIFFDGGKHNNLTSNTLEHNDENITGNYPGIWIADAYTTVRENIVSNNSGVGIFISGNATNPTRASYNNSIAENTLLNNTHGIYIQYSYNNTLTSNTVYNNSADGIYFLNSSNNTIFSNRVYNNSRWGINLSSSNHNTIYNNYFANANNVNDTGSNTWNITRKLGTNIMNGQYLGGNYWSDYNGADNGNNNTYPWNISRDEIGDTNIPYYGTTSIQNGGDYLPLVVLPNVTSATPTGAGVSTPTNIVVIFDKSMNQTTVENDFVVSPSIYEHFSWSDSNKTLTVDPSYNLEYNTQYQVTIGWNSTDEDGNFMISNYTWSFTTKSRPGSGEHYIPPLPIEEKVTSKEEVENLFNISLEYNFSTYDMDGDGIVDVFTDPNGVLNSERLTNISGNVSFLISVNGSLDKLFIWDVEADAISKVTHKVGVITDTVMDVQNNSFIVTVNINKSNWVYIELTDQYAGIFNLTVETSDGKVISSDMIWRENGKIYVLDDPDTEYQFAYYYTILTPTFDPTDGAIFNFSNPTITITYNETVIVIRATLNDELINLSTTDNKIFIYTLETNLTNGSYTLSINVQDTENNSRTDTTVYTINLEKSEDQPEITSYEESPWIALIVIMIILTVIFLLFKAGYI